MPLPSRVSLLAIRLTAGEDDDTPRASVDVAKKP